MRLMKPGWMPLVAATAALLLAPWTGSAWVGPRRPAPLGTQRLAQTGNARVEVLVLEGTMGAGGVDPGVAHLPQLRQPPFNAWTQIALVGRHTLSLGAAGAEAPLPNGGAARVTSSGRGGDGRYPVTVQFTLNGQTSRIEFVSSPGEPFFTVRSRNPQRALIVGFIVRQ